MAWNERPSSTQPKPAAETVVKMQLLRCNCEDDILWKRVADANMENGLDGVNKQTPILMGWSVKVHEEAVG